jgi:hypothetical protein
MAHAKEQNRSCKVYYVRCPEDSELPPGDRHFVLEDAAEPRWQSVMPASPRSVQCALHGPGYAVTVTEPWKAGFVSDIELREGWTFTEPLPERPSKPSAASVA